MFIDLSRFLKRSLAFWSKILKPSDLNRAPREIGPFEFYEKEMTCPYWYFNSIFENYKPGEISQKENFETFSSDPKETKKQRFNEPWKSLKVTK